VECSQKTDGKYVVAQMEVTYDMGTGERASTGQIPLEMSYTAAENGYVNAEWGSSENNRRARFYQLTAAGRKRLQVERDKFNRMIHAIERVMQPA